MYQAGNVVINRTNAIVSNITVIMSNAAVSLNNTAVSLSNTAVILNEVKDLFKLAEYSPKRSLLSYFAVTVSCEGRDDTKLYKS